MKWAGSVTGNQLEGTAVWLKDSRELRYWFKGTLQGGGETPAPAPRGDADPSPGP